MTDHLRFRKLAAASLDFELAPRDAEDLARHLAGCATCTMEQARLRFDGVALLNRTRAAMPPGMSARFERDWLTRARRTNVADLRLVLGLAAVLLLGVAFALAGAPRPSPTAGPSPDVVAPGNRPIGEPVLLTIGSGPGLERSCALTVDLACSSDVLEAFGAIWTTGTDRVMRIEAHTGRVLADIPVDGFPIKLAADDRSVWVSVRGPGSVVRIDPQGNVIRDVIAVPGLPGGIAIGAGGAWLADEQAKSIVRLDPASGTVLGSAELSFAPWDVATTNDAVWATDRYGQVLAEIDPGTTTARASHAVPGAAPNTSAEWGDGLATDAGRVYVASNAGIARFDSGDGSFVTSLTPQFPHAATYLGRLWLLVPSAATVMELDPATLTVIASQNVAIAPAIPGGWDPSIAVTADAVWIRSYEDGALLRLDRG